MNLLKIGLKTRSVAYINTYTNISTVTIHSTFDSHPAGVSQISVPVRVFLPVGISRKIFQGRNAID
jgi:hypothetical protein